MNSPSSALALEARASPLGPVNFVVNDPPGVPTRTFPSIGRGSLRSDWKSEVKLSYTRYALFPSGESAIAGKSARSPPAAMFVGVDQWSPRSLENVASACSWFVPLRASDQTTAISSVAPVPVGAPLAMSTLG